MLTLQNAWIYTVMVVGFKNVVLMEVNGAFLATNVVRGRICYHIKYINAIKSILLVIFDISETLISTKAPSALLYGK